MISALIKEAVSHGDRLSLLSVDRLTDLKGEIAAFEGGESLNGFQKWIVDGLYRFDTPDAGFPIRSIILVAIPHAAYARVQFTAGGKKCDCLSLVMSDFAATHRYLGNHLQSIGCRMVPAPNLPLKRLAARSGLAVYGRNNICYIEGMGSYFSLAAYFTDLDCGSAGWSDLRIANTCRGCKVCLASCPTGAIREGRFLIDNERCLSCVNENDGDFPEWVPQSAHHCVYDCLKCQINCPMNRAFAGNVMGPIEFTEEETGMILEGRKFEAYPAELKRKATILGLQQWPNGIPRNLRVLFELSGTS